MLELKLPDFGLGHEWLYNKIIIIQYVYSLEGNFHEKYQIEPGTAELMKTIIFYY